MSDVPLYGRQSRFVSGVALVDVLGRDAPEVLGIRGWGDLSTRASFQAQSPQNQPETRNQKPEIRNQEPKTQKPETRSHKP
jgi:hypothetical protein